MPMFREDVIESRKFRLSGRVVISPPKIYAQLLTIILSLCFLALIIMQFMKFSIHEDLEGFVTSNLGIIKIIIFF